MSPARLLAKSLTDCETRGEWVREETSSLGELASYRSSTTRYVNKLRDITISRTWYYGSFFSEPSLATPFTLSEAETEIVKDALKAFDRRGAEDREAEALSRLTAPREGLKPVRGETPQSGSTAKPRKPGAKARARKVSA